MADVLSDDLVRFVQTHLGSVWALRMMVTMLSEPERAWNVGTLVRELRATELLISSLLDRFQVIGLVAQGDKDVWYWRPATIEMEGLSQKVSRLYALTPFKVIQVIAAAPQDRLRQFADAFRLRRD